jgi:CheY-like chemotaxis protein
VKKILWLDNDKAYTIFGVSFLEEKGYSVTVVETPTEAEQKLKQTTYDLIIIDVMVPTKTAQEEENYRPEETERGYKTGLVFYRKHRYLFSGNGTRVLVLTVRLDKTIQEEFSKAALPPEWFSTKYELQDVNDLYEKVESILSGSVKQETGPSSENKSASS